MHKLKHNQRGVGAIETILILTAVVVIGAVGLVVYKNHTKSGTKIDSSTKTSTTTTEPEPSNPSTHTAQDAVAFTQTTYDTYLAAVNKANSDTSNTKPVAQVGLAAVKDALSPDLYAKAAAVTQATPFSCTAQYVADKYTASLTSSDKTSAAVAMSISNGDNLSTNGMSVTVDLASLKITAVKCP